MSQVLASTEARNRLPTLIEELVAHPASTVEVGRQRKREVVMIAAARFDEMVEREEAIRDLAWTEFAAERTENPTGAPISLDDARKRRR